MSKNKMEQSLFRLGDMLDELHDRSQAYPDCEFTTECIQAIEHVTSTTTALLEAASGLHELLANGFHIDNEWPDHAVKTFVRANAAIAHAKGESHCHPCDE